MSEEPKSLSAFRKEVYQYLKDNGIELLGAQTGLSKILKSVYENRVTEVPQDLPPTEHHFICIACLGVKVKVGKSGKNYVGMLKYAREKAVHGFVKSGVRENLLTLVERSPAMVADAIDAAYTAGMEDARPLYKKEEIP